MGGWVRNRDSTATTEKLRREKQKSKPFWLKVSLLTKSVRSGPKFLQGTDLVRLEGIGCMSQLIPANPGFLATTPPPGFSDPVIGVSVLFLALCLSSLWRVHRVTKSCRKRKRHFSPATSPEGKQSGNGERVEVQPIPFLLPSGITVFIYGRPNRH